MRTFWKWNAIGAVGVVAGGMLLLASCQKEVQDYVDPGTTDGLVDPEKSYTPSTGAHIYAIGPHPSWGTMLYEVMPGTSTPMVFRGIIRRRVSPTSNQPVDHFKGMTWDPDSNCTWLVTDRTAANASHRNALWRINGPLPTTGAPNINVIKVADLIDFTTGDTVRDAMDIEWDPLTRKVFLLRATPTIPGSQFAILNVAGSTIGQVKDLDELLPEEVQAFTFDCADRLVALRAGATDVKLYGVDRISGGSTTYSALFSTDALLAQEAGLEAWGPGCEMVAVNAFVTNLGIGSMAPAYATHPSLRNTLDMTTMP